MLRKRKSPKAARDANPDNAYRKKMREESKYGTVSGKKYKITKPGKTMKVGEMRQGKKPEKGYKTPPIIIRVK
jgi:hypothetical protein